MGFFDSVQNTVQNIADSPIWYANPWTAAGKAAYEGAQWGYDKYKGNPYRGQNWGAFGTSEGGFNWGMVPFVGAGFTNERNLQYQKQNQAYQMQLQREMFNREDTSIARRTKDLVMSGLSPVLAAGQGAGAGPAIATKALEAADTSNSAMQMLSIISGLTGLETQIKQQEKIDAEKRLINAQSSIKWWDFEKYVESGMASNASGLAKVVRDAIQLLTQASKTETGKKAKKQVEDLKQKWNENEWLQWNPFE